MISFESKDIDDYEKIIKKKASEWTDADIRSFQAWVKRGKPKKEDARCSPESTDVGESAKQ